MSNRRSPTKEARMQEVMLALTAYPQFTEYMELIKSLKDQAVEFAATHDSVKDQRATLASLGSVRTYLDIIAVHESALAFVEERRLQVEESKSKEPAE